MKMIRWWGKVESQLSMRAILTSNVNYDTCRHFGVSENVRSIIPNDTQTAPLDQNPKP
jgi:hypothetical protein